MFGKMMNNYYYGKSGKGDFRRDDMPETRMQLFWDTLRTRLSGLCRLNLIYMLAWLPAIVVIVLFVSRMYTNLTMVAMVKENDYAAYVQITADAEREVTITEEEYNELRNAEVDLPGYLKQDMLKMLAILIPCIALTGPFTAGMSYVTRNWARDEHAFIWSDFRDAVKENWKIPLVLPLQNRS